MDKLSKWLEDHKALLQDLRNALESAGSMTPDIVNFFQHLYEHLEEAKEPAAEAPKRKTTSAGSAS